MLWDIVAENAMKRRKTTIVLKLVEALPHLRPLMIPIKATTRRETAKIKPTLTMICLGLVPSLMIRSNRAIYTRIIIGSRG